MCGNNTRLCHEALNCDNFRNTNNIRAFVHKSGQTNACYAFIAKCPSFIKETTSLNLPSFPKTNLNHRFFHSEVAGSLFHFSSTSGICCCCCYDDTISPPPPSSFQTHRIPDPPPHNKLPLHITANRDSSHPSKRPRPLWKAVE